MKSSPIIWCVLCLGLLALAGAPSLGLPATLAESTNLDEEKVEKNTVKVQYLEIVTPMVNETCEALGEAHGVTFGDPIPEFGNARTAELKDGGKIGVRAPMRTTETPIVRPYVLVEDIQAAVKAATKAGATVALPPMEMPGGHGTFSIYILGGIEHGLWQL